MSHAQVQHASGSISVAGSLAISTPVAGKKLHILSLHFDFMVVGGSNAQSYLGINGNTQHLAKLIGRSGGGVYMNQQYTLPNPIIVPNDFALSIETIGANFNLEWDIFFTDI